MNEGLQKAAALVLMKYRRMMQDQRAYALSASELREAEQALLREMSSDAPVSVVVGALLIQFDEEYPNESPVRYAEVTNINVGKDA